jgi:biopolymer transport protein ExbD
MGAALGGGGGKRAGIVAINVTPMVDVMLVLLIIMMVTSTVIVSQSLKVELPKSSSVDDKVNVVAEVTIQKDGAFFFKGGSDKDKSAVSEAELISKLRTAKAENDDLNLVISGDDQAQHGRVVHVIDLAKVEGITKFAISVEQK